MWKVSPKLPESYRYSCGLQNILEDLIFSNLTKLYEIMGIFQGKRHNDLM